MLFSAATDDLVLAKVKQFTFLFSVETRVCQEKKINFDNIRAVAIFKSIFVIF